MEAVKSKPKPKSRKKQEVKTTIELQNVEQAEDVLQSNIKKFSSVHQPISEEKDLFCGKSMTLQETNSKECTLASPNQTKQNETSSETVTNANEDASKITCKPETVDKIKLVNDFEMKVGEGCVKKSNEFIESKDQITSVSENLQSHTTNEKSNEEQAGLQSTVNPITSILCSSTKSEFPYDINIIKISSKTAEETSTMSHLDQCDSKSLLKVDPQDFVELKLLQKKKIYPALKPVQYDVLSIQPLIKAYKNALETKTHKEATRSFEEFTQVLKGMFKNMRKLKNSQLCYQRAKIQNQEQQLIEKEEFFEKLRRFNLSRRSLIEAQNDLKLLDSRFKKMKNELWKTVSKNTSAKGRCEDGNMVDICHTYSIKERNENNLRHIGNILKELKEIISSDFSFFSYTNQLLRLQIEFYIHYFLSNSPTFSNKSNSSLLSAFIVAMPPEEYAAEMRTLRAYISILFSFQRHPIKDKEFIEASRKWLTRLVAVLLRSGTLKDNLFILNHVLRCPAGISTWAVNFVQLPLPPLWTDGISESCKTFGSDYLDHSLLVLYMILHPVPGREDYMKHIKALANVSYSLDSSDCSFVVLDSEGEEINDSADIMTEWTEDDIVSLLNQVPISAIFQHVLLISSEDRTYDVKRTTEEGMQRLFALATFLLDLFYNGLKTYSCKSYVQLTKRIGRLMRHTVQYISDHWQNYKDANISLLSNFEQQVEFDRFFFHAVYNMFTLQEVGAWVFLAGLPYTCVSPKMLWNILWIFHCSFNEEKEENVYSEKDVDIKLKSETVRLLLQEKLSSVDYTEALYLLNAFAKMAVSRENDSDFVCCVTREIFEASFINDQLRELLSKEGRTLISSIVEKHPFVISFLLKEIKERDEQIGMMSIFLFEEISMAKWMPEPQDMTLISEWLLSSFLSSPRNQLARLLLKRLNWSFDDQSKTLVLPIELHRQVAVTVAQAYSKYDSNGDAWSVSRGISQMLQLYAPLHSGDDQGFVSWAWELLFSLKLHVLDMPNPPWVKIYDGEVDTEDLPDLHRDPWLHPILRAVENKQPAGCYLAIVMTNIGHSVKIMTKEGLQLISFLVELKQYAAAIQALYYVLPFFTKNTENLLSNERFLTDMYNLTTADQSGMNIFNRTVVGTVLKDVAAKIKDQISQAWNVTVECASPLLKLWMQILIKLLQCEDKKGLLYSLKAAEHQVYYLLDVIVQIGFAHLHTRDGIQELMSTLSKPLTNSSNGNRKQSYWNFRFSMASGKKSSLLPAESLPDYAWFAWCVLLSETNQRGTQDLWLALQSEMAADTTILPDVALKKASNSLKIITPPLQSLAIYRWGQQALDTPMKHPILPLLWQQFFLLYLQRISSSSGLPERGSVGERFFKNGAYQGMLKKMKKKLGETADIYHGHINKISSELEELLYKGLKSNDSISESHEIRKNKLKDDLMFHHNLLLTFNAFSLWIEDLKLHSSNLCLPALEPKYCTDKLKLILQNDQRPWMDLINFSQLKEELEQKNCQWHQKKISEAVQFFNSPTETVLESATERIIRYLHSYENPQPLPSLDPLKPPVEEVSNSMLSSWDILVKIVECDQKIICDQARKFDEQISKLKSLDNVYLDLVPKEYEMVDTEVVHRKPCYKGPEENEKGCAGAAVFHLTIKQIKRSEKIQERIENNRINYRLTLNDILKPPPPELCKSALHVENCVRTLVKKMKSAKGQQAQMLRNMGISLFYHQIELTEKAAASVSNYPPSIQFFSSSIDLLGTEFIDGQEDQCLQLAKTLLSHPSAAGLASPFFDPNNASVEVFLNVYEVLAESVLSASPSAVIVLLSKVDLEGWLNKKKISFSERRQLLKSVVKALFHCGINPDEEILAVYEIFKRHMRSIFLYQFPEHYGDIVCLLLHGMEESKVCIDLWYEMFRSFGCAVATSETDLEEVKCALKQFALNQHLPPDQQQYVCNQHLQFDQIEQTLHLFHRYFMDKRHSSSSGMYQGYKEYLPAIGVFLGIMGHSLMELYYNDALSPGELNSNVHRLWEMLHKAFHPWIDPSLKDAHLLFPWSPDEEDSARIMFQIFTMCLGFHHEQLLGRKTEPSILSYVWNYYVRVYVNPGLRNYSVIVCHFSLVKLPWHQFYPSAEDINGMCKVLQSEIPESRAFLAEISIRIPWVTVMKHLSETKPSNIVASTLGMLGKLLIIAAWEFSIIKTNLHQSTMKSLEILSWNMLTPEMVEELLDLYSSFCNPFKIIINESVDGHPDIYVLQFLKIVCGMVPNSPKQQQMQMNQKRLLYLNRYIKLVSHCAAGNAEELVNKFDKHNFVLPMLLRELELVILKDITPPEQVNAAIPMMREVLGLLNDISDPKLQQLALDATVTWLSASSQSPLLLPSLKVACCSLASMNHLVNIVECCITARFDTELQDPAEAQEIWCLISSYFQVPQMMLDDFLRVCIQQNAYLTLFNYILHRSPQCLTSASKVMLLQNIVDWTERIKPNEKIEAKLILLWDKILELSVQLASQDELAVQNALRNFCSILSMLGEDRSRDGLLAAVGLGKYSALSVNFRFLCRAMAAFILIQMPRNGSLRLELLAPGHIQVCSPDHSPVQGIKESLVDNTKAHPSSEALKAVNNLKSLLINKPYAALKSQVDCALNYALNPRYCLLESRQVLKELAPLAFPNRAYLYVLDMRV